MVEEGLIFTKFSVRAPCSYFHTLGMECRPIRSETIALQDLLTNPTVNSLPFVAVCTDCLVLADKVSVLDDLKTSGALEASLVVNPAYGQSSHSWLWLSCRTDLRPHSLAGWSLFLVDRNYSGLHQSPPPPPLQADHLLRPRLSPPHLLRGKLSSL